VCQIDFAAVVNGSLDSMQGIVIRPNELLDTLGFAGEKFDVLMPATIRARMAREPLVVEDRQSHF
jgi:hypothetical protein